VTLREERLRVYADADVLLSGIATENTSAASRVVLEASELTLLDLVTAQKGLEECDRNLRELVSERSDLENLRRSLREAIDRAVEIVEDPDALSPIPETDPKDVIHLTCAVDHNCDFFVTYNVGDYPKSYRGVSVVEPGTLVKRIREQIRALD